MRRARLLGAAGACLSVVLLAGCNGGNGDDEPQARPTTTASSPSESEPGPISPARPEIGVEGGRAAALRVSLGLDPAENLLEALGVANAREVGVRLEQAAVLRLPAEQVHGVAAWLRQFTTLPLGAYPNWGRYLRYEWDWSTCPGPDVFAEHAQQWAAEGMQIIGGCCGARPIDIQALTDAFKQPAGVG